MKHYQIILLFLLISASMVCLSSSAQSGEVCGKVTQINDLVVCHGLLYEQNTGPFHVSEFLKEVANDSEMACTKSQSSAQPARPLDGDLRCMFRLSLGTEGSLTENTLANSIALTFNIVEGVNDDHVELSRSLSLGDDSNVGAVVMAHFDFKTPLTLKGLFESALKPIRHRMTCASCHVPRGSDSILMEGHQVWPLKHIPFDRTVTGSIPKNGPLKPDELKIWLADRWSVENCDQIRNETCRRLEVLRSVTRFIDRF